MRITRRAKSITALSLSAVLLLGGAASATLGQAAPSPVTAIVVYDAEAKSAAAQAIAGAGEDHAVAVEASRKVVAEEAAAKAKAEEEAAAQAEADAQAQAAQQAAEAEYAAQAAEEALAVAAPASVPVQQTPVQVAPAPVEVGPNVPVWSGWTTIQGSLDPTANQAAVDARTGGWATTSLRGTVLGWAHVDAGGASILGLSAGDRITFDGVAYRVTQTHWANMNQLTAWENSQVGAAHLILQTCATYAPDNADPAEMALTAVRI